jgi:hypothetical protein
MVSDIGLRTRGLWDWLPIISNLNSIMLYVNTFSENGYGTSVFSREAGTCPIYASEYMSIYSISLSGKQTFFYREVI